MKINHIILLCLSLMISACNQMVAAPEASENISQRTNDIAISNLNLGIAYMQNGNYEKALEKLLKAKEADSRYVPTLNALGVLHQRIGENEKSENYFKNALKINPRHSSTLNNYGQFLCQNNRYEEAEKAFLDAASNPLYETPEIAYANAGSCNMKSDNITEAENYYRKALDLNPALPVALLQMSEISYMQLNYLSARGYLQRYLEKSSHTPKSLWLGIRIERELGDKNALASYSLLLKNNYPDSEEAALLRQTEL